MSPDALREPRHQLKGSLSPAPRMTPVSQMAQPGPSAADHRVAAKNPPNDARPYAGSAHAFSLGVVHQMRACTASLGGPTACKAPVGSRSDKRPRHAGSIDQKTFVPQFALMSRSRWNCSRMMGPLVAARPRRPDGTAGPPELLPCAAGVQPSGCAG